MKRAAIIAAMLASSAVIAGCQSAAPVMATASDQKWNVRCSKDRVTNVSRCFAGTFVNSVPFQVYYVGGSGPYIMAGFHTHPGARPVIRFDNDQEPFFINNDAGVTDTQPDTAAVERMRSAKTAVARYVTWPDKSRTMDIDLSGFNEAYDRLLAMK